MAPGAYYNTGTLLEKLKNGDPDLRFMGMNDLSVDMRSGALVFDISNEQQIVEEVLKHMDDSNSEVKNITVKCVAQMIKVVSEAKKEMIMNSLIAYLGGNKDDVRDLTSLALKTITMEIPTTGTLATIVTTTLVPQLLNILRTPDSKPELTLESLTVLTTIFSRLGPQLKRSPELLQQSFDVLKALLNNSRVAIRKRAIAALAQLIPLVPVDSFTPLLNSVLQQLTGSASPSALLTSIQLLTAVGRSAPSRLTPKGPALVEGLIAVLPKTSDEETKESAVQALEQLVLGCETESTPGLVRIVGVAVEFVKYDPNYADDDAMEEDDEQDEDEELPDEYDDDEDTSYKVRRAALKLLHALIPFRTLLPTLLRSAGPVLVARFGDREESVRTEVWSTFAALVRQTGVHSGAGGGADGEPRVSGKRKRDETMDVVEEDSLSQLRALVPNATKALLKQLSPKSPHPTLTTGFSLLSSIQTALPGVLGPYSAQLLALLAKLLALPSSELAAHLLSFLAAFFAGTPSRAFADSLPTIAPPLLALLADRFPRVAGEAFRAAAELTRAAPTAKKYTEKIYAATIKRLSTPDTDAGVRALALTCLGELVVSAPDVARNGAEWQALLRARGEMLGPAIRVTERVAREGPDGLDTWLAEGIPWCLSAIRRGARALRLEAFSCLQVILKRLPVLSEQGAGQIVKELTQLLNEDDLHVLTLTLSTLALTLQRVPAVWKVVEQVSLPRVYVLAKSPTLHGASAALDALLAFFAALVGADKQIANHAVSQLILAAVPPAPPPAAGGTKKGAQAQAQVADLDVDVAGLATVSRCIATVVQNSPADSAGVIAHFAAIVASGRASPDLVLALYSVGEIGRFIPMNDQPQVFTNAYALLSSDLEKIRAAAAFAIGNIAIGNLEAFLPYILQSLQSTDQTRVGALHALREVVTNSPKHELEYVADELWTPLFENTRSEDESTKNVAAACLGRLATTSPARFLPRLQTYIAPGSPPGAKAAVATAMRYVFMDSAQAYDDLVAPMMGAYVELMSDDDITVRRLTIVSLNSAARNKPHLLRPHMHAILPRLYKETNIRQDLIHIVIMGPWKHQIDDGLETRKAAYETMYTLLDTSLKQIEMPEYISRVVAGLTDKDEIKALCHMMLFRLAQVSPDALIQRLDQIAEPLEKTMEPAAVTKDTVKQDLERVTELQQSAVRAIAALVKANAQGQSAKFDSLVENVRKGPLQQDFVEMLN